MSPPGLSPTSATIPVHFSPLFQLCLSYTPNVSSSRLFLSPTKCYAFSPSKKLYWTNPASWTTLPPHSRPSWAGPSHPQASNAAAPLHCKPPRSCCSTPSAQTCSCTVLLTGSLAHFVSLYLLHSSWNLSSSLSWLDFPLPFQFLYVYGQVTASS